MELQLKIIGVVLIALSAIHIGFSKYFDWKKDLQPLMLINRQMMEVHTFFVALTVFLIGVLSVCCTHDLITTKLGKQISLGLSIFWGVRLIFQFFVYSPKLWKGKTFETTMHVLFAMLWIYLTTTYFLIYQS